MQELILAIIDVCRANPSLLLFAALAAGYAIGKVKIGGFALGSTTSVLLVAILLGALTLRHTELQLGVIKTVSFGLFIFAIGYKVGPDFIGGLKRGGVKYVTLAVFFCVTALIAAIALAKAFGLNGGYAGGILAGALTQSSVIGTADSALQHLANGSVVADMNLRSDVAVAYAVTYIFGTAGLILLLKLLPRLWRIDLPAAARQAEAELGGGEDEDSTEAFHWSNLISPRVYRVDNADIIGKSVREVEAQFPERVAIDMIKKGGQVLDQVTTDMIVEAGDLVVLSGYRRRIYGACQKIGPEVNDDMVKGMLGEIIGICLTNKALDGKTLAEVFAQDADGCFIRRVTRQGHALPLNNGLTLYRGDIVEVIGARKDVETLIKRIGYPERAIQSTDLVAVGAGIMLGTLVGLLAINVGGIPITLGVGGGVLVAGIFFGWLRSVRPTWGQIPAPAQWVFMDLGLNLFIACVGLSAGPRALEAVQQAGATIFLAGVSLTLIPHLLTWLFGLYVLKLNPALLLGAMTGAGTCTAALNTVREDAHSGVPVIGYTVPYAIGNVLLTVWGALIVSIL
ncbi:aspartate-alanine antiporter [uncultured Thiodictyon sp.]|uniref:aspartate-alanine antiporter n=1 Tax=uncultured Thiodictyon sp. TaxID=1846217 RepID=UPI0025DF5A77|nr:aspartate-alanine antiporter [uncultured Thiodictyon sp.]